MSRLNCEIVRDLIPSYVDGICSQGSREAVEEHVKECAECRESLEMLKCTAIEGGGLNQGELDHMKKARRYFSNKSALAVSGLLLLLLLVFGGWTDYFYDIWHNKNLYYVLFPVMALGFYGLLADYREKPTVDWRSIAMGVVSALGIVYCLALVFLLYRVSQTNTAPFGMRVDQLGFFIDSQLVGIIIVELLIFAGFVADAIKRGHTLGSLHIVSLLGGFLGMLLRTILNNMSDPATLQKNVVKLLVPVLLEGLLLAAVEFGVNRFFLGSEKNS